MDSGLPRGWAVRPGVAGAARSAEHPATPPHAVPKAYVALAPGHEPTRETALSILRHARENLAPFLRVRKIEFYELPKTISGKIRRVELRQREVELSPSGGSPNEFSDTDFPELRG